MTRPSLRTRIYLSMIALIVVSFIVIGSVTFFFFQSQNEEYHTQRLIRKETTIMAAIEYFLESENVSLNPDSVEFFFQRKVDELADVNNLDLNLYNLKGELLVTSNPDLFISELLPTTLPPSLLTELDTADRIFIEEEERDTLSLLNSYQYILDISGYPIGIANIPYFDVNQQMSIEAEAFFKTLVETYLILFLGALALGFYLTQYITRSLKKVRQTIKETRLGTRLKTLEWESDDEIGDLVEEYNRMVRELEESAAKLAETERDHAWREMARQVAHEIKNPLTPMKLTVQQFERKLSPNSESFHQDLKKFTHTMVTQIDALSSIAASFSRFATLPMVEAKEENLSEILENMKTLYDEKGVEIGNIAKELRVPVDRELIVRVMNNLIQNALQAVPDGKEPKVILSLKRGNNQALIQVEDNGSGISEEKKEKIFEPSFTTKTTGMGLGLAIVKRIIVNHGGKIWFESSPKSGTTFFIALPMGNE